MEYTYICIYIYINTLSCAIYLAFTLCHKALKMKLFKNLDISFNISRLRGTSVSYLLCCVAR